MPGLWHYDGAAITMLNRPEKPRSKTRASAAAKPPKTKPSTGSDRASKAPAVTRSIQILRLLARSELPLGMNVIARELGLIPSTALHILRALESEGILTLASEDKKYSLGVGLVALGHSARNRSAFARAVDAELRELAREFRSTSVALQLESSGRAFVVVGVAPAVGSFAVQVDIGRRFPALISAAGRCFAAHSGIERSALREMFDQLRWDVPPKFREWMAGVDEASRTNIGVDQGSYMRGFSVLASPVFENGRMTRALSAVFAQGQLDANALREFKDKLRAAAKRLSA